MATEIITAFNGGEASRNLESRNDLEFYKRLCSVAENVDIQAEGGAITRAGSKYIAGTKNGTLAYLREFSYSDEYSYAMEMGDEYIRIYDNQSETAVEDLVSPWSIEDIPELDFHRLYDVMWVTHKDYPVQIIKRTAVDTFTIEAMEFEYPPLLDRNDTDTTLAVAATTGTGIAITASADLFEAEHVGATFSLQHERSGAQVSINSTSAVTFNSSALDVSFCNWRVETGGTWNGLLVVERSFDGGVTWESGEKVADTRNVNAGNFSFDSAAREGANTKIRIAWTAASGTISYNLSCIDLYTYGLVEITAVTDAQNATCDIISEVGSTSAITRWAEGAFSEYRGYPRTVVIHEDRLTFSGTNTEPNTIWMSFTDDYYNFFAGTLADEGIRRSPNVNGFTQWLVSKGDLFIGTTSELITMSGYTSTEPIKPDNLRFNIESSFGGAYREPVLANNVVLYLQKDNATIREILFDDDTKTYRSQDISRIAKQITGLGVSELTLMRLPEQRLHCVLDDGQKGILTYERAEEVVAWRRYSTDGSYISSCVVYNGAEDAVWNIVLRDGSYLVEKEQSRKFSGTDYWCVDSGASGYLSAATAVSDAALDGTDVVVTSAAHGLSDGNYVRISGISGMTELNDNIYEVANSATNTFKLKTKDGISYIDGSGFTAYESGGTATQVSNTLSGLTHLNGKTVAVIGDGIYDGDHVVSAGAVTLNDYYNRIIGGLKYECTVSPMPIEPQLMNRASSGKQKLVKGHVKLKLKDTIGGSFGSILGNLENLIPETTPPLGTSWELVNDDIEVYNFDGWDDIKRVYFKQTLPLPAEILSMVITIESRS